MLDNRKVVLLVDDDTEPLNLLEYFFQRNDYITRTAQSVIEAIQKLDEAVDLIVTDYDMPIMNGSDLRLMIRQKYPHIPVIGISGFRFIDKGHVAKLFDEFLYKPFRISELRDSVARVVFALAGVPA